jgi:hypothetical protein
VGGDAEDAQVSLADLPEVLIAVHESKSREEAVARIAEIDARARARTLKAMVIAFNVGFVIVIVVVALVALAK